MRPEAEQPERRETGGGLGGGKFFIQQHQRGDDQIHQEHKPEHQPRSLGERREIQEPGREQERHGDQAQHGTRKPVGRGLIGKEMLRICRFAKLGPPGADEEERVEAQQHGKRDTNLVAFKIFFGLEKFVRPSDLHDGRAERGQGGEEKPAAVQRNNDQPGVEDGDVTEESKRIVLAGREQQRGEEAAQHAEDGDDEGVEPHGDKERGRRDEHHQQESRHRAEELEVID